MSLRHVFHWKFLFYGLLLPILRRLPPSASDAVLGGMGAVSARLRRRNHAAIDDAIARAKAALDVDWDIRATRLTILANLPRCLARDALLDLADEARVLARFDWEGIEAAEATRAQGRGLIVVGAHYGAHLAALHGLYRRGWDMRLLVQRPRHVSRYLQRRFDEEGPRAQSRFFVRRGLTTGEAAEKILLARASLREGQVIYLNGDIPWSGSNTRRGSLLGRDQQWLTLWTDLAALTESPVCFLVAEHRPGGRYRVVFEPPFFITSGNEADAFRRFLAALERQVAHHPEDAVPYLTWPSFGVGARPPKS